MCKREKKPCKKDKASRAELTLRGFSSCAAGRKRFRPSTSLSPIFSTAPHGSTLVFTRGWQLPWGLKGQLKTMKYYCPIRPASNQKQNIYFNTLLQWDTSHITGRIAKSSDKAVLTCRDTAIQSLVEHIIQEGNPSLHNWQKDKHAVPSETTNSMPTPENRAIEILTGNQIFPQDLKCLTLKCLKSSSQLF